MDAMFSCVKAYLGSASKTNYISRRGEGLDRGSVEQTELV